MTCKFVLKCSIREKRLVDNNELIKAVAKIFSIKIGFGFRWSWVQIPLRPTFCSYFKESFSGEYRMYQIIPLHSRDYLKKTSIKINVATDEGNSRNEIEH